MCGICGYTSSLGPEKDRRVIEDMKAYLFHRGPDGEGSFFSDDCVLGHRRLSIIDIESGSQPMANEDGSVRVVFNGEIYNYRDLWSLLESHGHHFASDHSDTEVIVHGYEQWGEGLFEKLNGIFAIAIWDSKKKLLLLARDHIGVKPLYYAHRASDLIFASEPKALFCHPKVKPQFNPSQLSNYFFFRAPIAPDTLFDGVKKLLPGSYITFKTKEGSLKEHTFWRPSVSGCCVEDNQEARELIRTQIFQSVDKQLMSDVPLGIFLSGGVDSSLVAAAAKNNTDNWQGFVVSVGGKCDEGVRSQEIADFMGVKNNILNVNGNDFLKYLNKWVYYNDDPVSDPSALALLLISKFARDSGKKVMLAGEGGDELFAGYNSYRRFLFYDRLKKYPFAINVAAKFLKGVGYGNYRENDYIFLKKTGLNFPGTAHDCSFDILTRVLDKNLYPLCSVFDIFKNYGINEGAVVDRACLFDQKIRLPNDLLLRTDRASMAVGLEVRVPLLDYKLVEQANCISSKLKIKRGCLKAILKEVLSDYLPPKLVYRKKMGFDLPLEKWLRCGLAEEIENYLSKRKISCLDYDELRKIIGHFMKGKSDSYSGFVWSYLLLEKWCETWCGASRPDAMRTLI